MNNNNNNNNPVHTYLCVEVHPYVQCLGNSLLIDSTLHFLCCSLNVWSKILVKNAQSCILNKNGENTHWSVLIVLIKVWRRISVLSGICAQIFWRIPRSWACSHRVQPQPLEFVKSFSVCRAPWAAATTDYPEVQIRNTRKNRTNHSQRY